VTLFRCLLKVRSHLPTFTGLYICYVISRVECHKPEATSPVERITTISHKCLTQVLSQLCTVHKLSIFHWSVTAVCRFQPVGGVGDWK
jgi:hypothetical protein